MRGDEIQDLAELLLPADQLGNRLWSVGRRQDRCGLRCDRANGLARACRHHADLAGELVAASGDRAGQLALRPEGGAQGRNLAAKLFSSMIRAGHTCAISAYLLTTAPCTAMPCETRPNREHFAFARALRARPHWSHEHSELATALGLRHDKSKMLRAAERRCSNADITLSWPRLTCPAWARRQAGRG
jgi:hypothetical protein